MTHFDDPDSLVDASNCNIEIRIDGVMNVTIHKDGRAIGAFNTSRQSSLDFIVLPGVRIQIDPTKWRI